MNKKLLKLMTVTAAFALGLTSCGGTVKDKPSQDDEQEQTETLEEQKYTVYLMAKAAGYEGSYQGASGYLQKEVQSHALRDREELLIKGSVHKT